MIPRPPLGLRRTAFWAYTLVLFVGTHYPKIQVPGTGRPDLLVHLVAFGLWAGLLIGCEFFGPALGWRNLARCAAVGALYAAADEVLQGLPFVGRVPALDDWAADVAGILAAVGIAAVAGRLASRRAQASPASSR